MRRSRTMRRFDLRNLRITSACSARHTGMLTKAGNNEAQVRTYNRERKYLRGGTLLEGGPQMNTDFKNYWLPRSVCHPCPSVLPSCGRTEFGPRGTGRPAQTGPPYGLRCGTQRTLFRRIICIRFCPVMHSLAQLGAFVFQLTDLK